MQCWGELPNPNALVAASKGMQAIKLCTNRIIQLDVEVLANAS